MLSGNGRHRRPRQAPALVVAAGVTGSAIAIPLLGATGAHAADGAAWDRVAECETGGAWSQNTGNGYYGGLQLSQDDWEAFGGLDYATTADQASRSQQIRVAERVLAAQGTLAWPTCGLLAGLDGGASGDGASDDASESTSSGAESDGSSGSTDSSTPSESTDGTGSAGSTDAADSSGTSDADAGVEGETGSGSGGSGSSAAPSATPSAGTTDGDGASAGSGGSSASASPVEKATGEAAAERDGTDAADATGSADDLVPSPGISSLTRTGEGGTTAGTGTGRHRGDGADEETAQGRSESSSGRHASRDDGTARDAGDGTYTVRAGDSLWTIADSLDLAGGWSSLYAANEGTVGADPDRILPGQKLAVAVEPVEK